MSGKTVVVVTATFVNGVNAGLPTGGVISYGRVYLLPPVYFPDISGFITISIDILTISSPRY